MAVHNSDVEKGIIDNNKATRTRNVCIGAKVIIACRIPRADKVRDGAVGGDDADTVIIAVCDEDVPEGIKSKTAGRVE